VLTASFWVEHTMYDDLYRRGIEPVESEKIDRKPLVSHAFLLDQSPEAFATQAKPDAAIKTLLKESSKLNVALGLEQVKCFLCLRIFAGLSSTKAGACHLCSLGFEPAD